MHFAPEHPSIRSAATVLWHRRCLGAALAMIGAQLVSSGGCTLAVQGELSQQCTSDEACEDGNVCTDPICTPDGLCQFVNVPNGPAGEQEPGDCLRIECQEGQLATVLDLTDTEDDANACTDDICDAGGGGPLSVPLPYPTPCEEGGGTGQCGCLDGDEIGPCVGDETPFCQIGCTPETAAEVCDDENPCTVDSCNTTTSLCAREYLDGVAAPDQAAGDCHLVLCTAGVAADEIDDSDLPDDANDCTDNVCVLGVPSNPPWPIDTACTDDDGHYCDGEGACVECNSHPQCGDTTQNCLCRQCQDHACVNLADGEDAPNCQTGNDCRILECDGSGGYTDEVDNADLPVSDNNGCTDDLCTAGAIDYHHNSLACDDDVYCNGTDTCSGGSCGVHTGNPCTGHNTGPACNDSCNESANDCTGPDAATTVCNDGLYCTVTDQCNSSGTCVGSGNPCPGPDGDGDCVESCNESSDNCTSADPNGSSCSDGAFCNGTDSCSGGACTTHSGNPCPGADGDNNCSESCNEGSDNCTAADPNGSACSDGLWCTGTETCTGGACGGSTGNPCSSYVGDADTDCSESCNESGDSCTANDPQYSACNDGTYCNGNDTCNASGSCANHAGDPCAPYTDGDCSGGCNEGSDNCSSNEPNGSACSDGTYCNGTDTCSNGACSVHAGDPCGMSDSNCTGGCDEGSDNCSSNEPSGSPCNDGAFCNGADTCDSGGSCSNHAGDPCASRIGDCDSDCSEACSESSDSCTANEPSGTICRAGTTNCNDYCDANGVCINS